MAMSNRKSVLFTAVFLVASLAPVAAVAQSNSSTQNVQELRTQLDQLREQMNKLQARLSELESRNATGVATPSAALSGPQNGTIQAAEPPREGPTSKQVGEATATYTT